MIRYPPARAAPVRGSNGPVCAIGSGQASPGRAGVGMTAGPPKGTATGAPPMWAARRGAVDRAARHWVILE
jgi:hypothetical protein